MPEILNSYVMLLFSHIVYFVFFQVTGMFFYLENACTLLMTTVVIAFSSKKTLFFASMLVSN